MVLAAWLFLKTVSPKKPVSPASALPAVVPQPTAESVSEPIQPEKNLAGDQLLDFNSWLTYGAPDFNFTLKYPAEWPSAQLANHDNIIYALAFKDNDL